MSYNGNFVCPAGDYETDGPNRQLMLMHGNEVHRTDWTNVGNQEWRTAPLGPADIKQLQEDSRVLEQLRREAVAQALKDGETEVEVPDM